MTARSEFRFLAALAVTDDPAASDAWVALDKIDRLEGQLERVRAELAAAIAAWDDALAECLPALEQQMPINVSTIAARLPMSAQLAAELGLPWEPDQ